MDRWFVLGSSVVLISGAKLQILALPTFPLRPVFRFCFVRDTMSRW